MGLISRNININNNTRDNSEIEWPEDEVSEIQDNYINQNKACGVFEGTVSAIRPIKSTKNKTAFAVIDIKVEGRVGVFQDFLNYNQSKKEQSTSFLYNHIKSMADSAGFDVDKPENGKYIAWVRETIEALIEQKATVQFEQSRTPDGLDINYL